VIPIITSPAILNANGRISGDEIWSLTNGKRRNTIIRDSPPFTLAGTVLFPRIGMVTTIELTLRSIKINVSICSTVICGIVHKGFTVHGSFKR